MPDVIRLEEVKGQDQVVKHLLHDLERENYNHAYMFIGKRGVGKKTLALAFAKSILCPVAEKGFCGECSACRRFDKGSYMEFISLYDEGDEAIKIQRIQDIIQEEHLKKYEGKYRIIFMENAERMTEEAANALLRILEEPLPGTIFILTVSNLSKILPTITSRVEKYYLNTLGEEELRGILFGMGLEAGGFAALGTIDEARVLLENKNKDIPDFVSFRELMESRDLGKGFLLADKLASLPYLRELLSYYEVKAMENYKLLLKEGKGELDVRIIRGLEEAMRKIKNNVSKKNSLEYCFLYIGGMICE